MYQLFSDPSLKYKNYKNNQRFVNINFSYKIILISLLLIFTQSLQFKQLDVVSDNYIIGQTAIYTIFYDRTQQNYAVPINVSNYPIAAGSTVTLTFPSQFKINSSIEINAQVNAGAVIVPFFTISGNVITITDLFSAQTIVKNVSLVISNVINPTPAITTSSFTGTIGSDNAVSIYQNSLVNLSPATFTTCYMTFNPKYVNRTSSMVLNITAKSNLPLDTTLQVQFPSIWTRDISTSNNLPIANLASMPCGSLSSNVKSTVNCYGDRSKLKITISNIFSSILPAGNFFIIQIKNFLSPPTNQAVDLIKITSYTTYNSVSYKVNTCTDYVSDLIPNVLSPSSILITSSTLTSLTVNRVYTLRFAFQTVDTFSLFDYFQIQFPGQQFNYNSLTLSGGIGLSRITSTWITSTNTLRMYMNTALSTKTYFSPYTMFIVVGQYTTPPSTQTTSPFKISIIRNGFPMQVGYQTLTPVATTLTASLSSRGTDVINRNTTFAFSITINDSLSSTGKIRIKFPSQMNILTNSPNCATVSGTNLASIPTCVINSISKTIDLISINSSSSSLITAQTFNLTIDGIQNPSSTIPSGSFEIRTFYKSQDTSLVAVGIISGIAAKESTMNAANILITSSSYKVLEQSVTYSVQIKNKDMIPADGWVQLFVPKPILLNLNVLSSSCKRGINLAATQTTSCSLISQTTSGYLLNFTSLFSLESLPVDSYLTLQLTSIITNPPSTSPTPSFKLYTYSSNSYLISKIQSSLAISMTTPTILTSCTYSRSSNKNYELATYDFTFKQIPQMEISSVVVIQFPSQIVVNLNSTCSMKSPIIDNNLTCLLVNSSAIKVTLPSTAVITTNTIIILSITNIFNPISYRPPLDFTISTYTSLLYYKYAVSKTTNRLSNSVPSQFTSVSGTYSPNQLDTNITLTVNFQAAHQAPGYLQLSLPSYFIINSGGLTCSQIANFNGNCKSISSYTLNITGTFPLKSITTFQVSGFKSPSTFPTSNFITLNSFTSDGYQLDQSLNQVTFNVGCTLPCKTCDSFNQSYCLSCYKTTSITDKILYDSLTNNCYSNCPNNYYQNYTSFQCSKCDSNCLTCQGTGSFCQSCNSTTIYKYLQINNSSSQLCVSSCKSGYYPQTSKSPITCVLCINNCSTCTSSTVCLSCITGNYLWESACSTSCPTGKAVADSSTGKCQLCNTNCKTCQITTTNCTSCTSPLFLYLNKCIASCSSPTVYRPQISTCGSCQTQCKTCQVSASNCTSCDSTSSYKYYFKNDCLKECFDLYYQSAGGCSLCSDLNINCDYCINSTYCQVCNLGFVFLDGQCLSKVPAGYVNISGQAKPCTGDCALCEVTQSNCTSCKTLNLNGNVCQTNCPSGTLAVNKTCLTCNYPCKTCSQNLNNCTSCLPNQSPQLYLIQNRCEITCPTYYYPNQGSNLCKPCQSPCEKCTDLSICDTCVSSYFLYNFTSCLSQCPSKTVGINKICEPCLSPCKTCTDSTTKCLTCQSTYFYLNSTNKCLLDCGQGLFKQYINQTCIACTEPCKTCANTTDTCLSCLTGILYQSKCIKQCPAKMYNNSNVCFDCPSKCSACSSIIICSACEAPYLLYNKFCINSCPETHAVIFNNQCTKCSDTFCHKCYDNDICFNCVSGYSLLNGACLKDCPVGYETNGTHCVDLTEQSLTSGSSFPVPFTITSSIVLVACLMSKLQNDKTFLSGAIFSLLGIVQVLALIYYIYLYFIGYFSEHAIGFYIAIVSLGVLYLLNILSFIQSIILCYDKKFCQWRDCSLLNKFYNGFSILISILISHKFKNLMFSRLFAFHIFSAMVQQVKRFKILNIFSFISLISSGGAIFSVITIIKLADSKTQFFNACLDVLIVTGLNIVFAFFNAIKGKDFFDQITPQGLLLNKRLFADQDSIKAKLQVDGNDIQNQQGYGYYSKVQHVLASTQAFKYNKKDSQEFSRNDFRSDDSLTNIKQNKQYEQISIQAYEMIEENQPTNKIDFSTLKPYETINNSKFTNIFENDDKSIQNTIDYNKKNDISIQKYNDISKVDKSLQRTKITRQKNVQKIISYNDRSKQQLNNQSFNLVQRQNLQQPQAQQFDIPTNQLKYHQQELQQKLKKKRQQIQRIRQQIKQKQIKNQKKQQKLRNQFQVDNQNAVNLTKKIRIQPNNQNDIKEQINKPNNIRNNFIVDMNKYIKQKDTNKDIDSIENYQDDSDIFNESVKTKAKNNKNKTNNISKQSIKNNVEQRKNTQSPILHEQASIPYQIQQSPQKITKKHRKNEGKLIKLIDDTNKPRNQQQLQQYNQSLMQYNQNIDKQNLIIDENNPNNSGNYIYQVSNNQLDMQEQISMQRFRDNISGTQTNKVNKNNNKRNINNKFDEQGFQSSATEIITNRKNKINNPKLVYDQTYINKQLNDPNSQVQDQLEEERQLQENISQNNQNLINMQQNPNIMFQQQDQQLNQNFNTSQDMDIPIGINLVKQMNKQRQIQISSEVQDTYRKNNKNSKKQIENYEEIRISVNQTLNRQGSNSKNKKIPSDRQQKINNRPQYLSSRFQKNYQFDKKNNSLTKRQPINKQPEKSSTSILSKVAQQIIASDNQNTVLAKKSPQKKNPLITKKKWQYENQNKLNDLSSENGQDSFVGGITKKATKVENNPNNRMKKVAQKNKEKPYNVNMIIPFQTDRQQTGFTISGLKQLNQSKNNFKQTKNISSNNKMAPRDLINSKNYAQQVQVHFDKDVQVNFKHSSSPPHQPYVRESTSQRKDSRQNRSGSKPSIPRYPNQYPNKPSFINDKKFQSQQIFGQSQSQSIDRNTTYYEHRNNILMDKINDRPQNQDLQQYYNRTSTRFGSKNKRSKSKNQSGVTSINLSVNRSKSGFSPKKEGESQRNLEKIYMQRLDPKTGRSGSLSKKFN